VAIKRVAKTLAAVAILWAAATGAASAEAAECDVSYTAVGGKWSEAVNWEGGELPTSAQNVCIPAGHGTVEIPFLFKAEAHRIRAESPLLIEVAGELKLADATPGFQDASYLADSVLAGGKVITPGSWLVLSGETRLRGIHVLSEPFISPASVRLASGTMAGAGQFGVAFVNEGGDVEPAGAGTVGTLFFNRGYTQTAGGTLSLDVAGPEDIDFLESGLENPQTFAGTVDIRPIAPFTPSLGEVWAFGRTSGASFEAPISGDYRLFGAGKSTLAELFEAEGPPPAVTRLSAKKGPAAGGTSVTITGTNFTRASTVRFGSTPATSVVVESTRSIIATSPPGTAGRVEVVVDTQNGASAATNKARFTYEGPTVTGLSPASGPDAGGSAVTVTGSGFATGAGTIFSLGKGTATSVNCSSTTECTLLTPAAAKPGAVDVRAKAGGKTSKKNPPGDRFTYSG
jgi:hypothetical protein